MLGFEEDDKVGLAAKYIEVLVENEKIFLERIDEVELICMLAIFVFSFHFYIVKERIAQLRAMRLFVVNFVFLFLLIFLIYRIFSFF